MSDEKNNYMIAGYIFLDEQDYKEARREAETVEYIKANTDLDNLNKTVKLYQKLVERKTLKTVIGFEFLKGLQERIRSENIISEDSIPPIRVDSKERHTKIYSNNIMQEHERKSMEQLLNLRVKLRNLRIICTFLITIIIVMIVISIYSDRNIFSKFENQIIDKYAAWEEELNEREQALRELEGSDSIE